ncbi:unnamed protein product [Protopolystoma xenopodis]|uniref:Uncharacterized protein n=1 Tax=Protopolystoma xenopodis TaxID=117903 RepID=A0A448XRZ2_9PLAT|nr:unnamed protein product [Protopolystoma xenopodis]
MSRWRKKPARRLFGIQSTETTTQIWAGKGGKVGWVKSSLIRDVVTGRPCRPTQNRFRSASPNREAEDQHKS